jgi:hypothetical protein
VLIQQQRIEPRLQGGSTHMKSIFVLFIFFASLSTFAETIETSVIGVERGRSASEDHLVMLSKDGQVGFLSPSQTELLQILELGEIQNLEFEITLDDDHYITAARALEKQLDISASDEPKTQTHLGSAEYTPTVLPNLAAATAIFKELNPNARDTAQCYNRAEVWSYEEFTRHQLYSKKVFLFFTTKYIRDYHYRWWFHVSPFVLVNLNGTITEEIIDYSFLRRPTPLKPWTDLFIQPKTDCTSVDRYSDYSRNQEATYCYVIKTSMYFWQPKDIQALETGTPAKTSFVQSDVNYAYKHGFR